MFESEEKICRIIFQLEEAVVALKKICLQTRVVTYNSFNKLGCFLVVNRNGFQIRSKAYVYRIIELNGIQGRAQTAAQIY